MIILVHFTKVPKIDKQQEVFTVYKATNYTNNLPIFASPRLMGSLFASNLLEGCLKNVVSPIFHLLLPLHWFAQPPISIIPMPMHLVMGTKVLSLA